MRLEANRGEKDTAFRKSNVGFAMCWEKKRGEEQSVRHKKGSQFVEGWRTGWGLKEESLVKLITSGSKFPVKRFYNTEAILLKEEAARPRPTFHLRLTFMSSTQFYHSEFNVYLSADAILPCYYLNRAVLIIISPRAGTARTFHPDWFCSSDLTNGLWSPSHNLCFV